LDIALIVVAAIVSLGLTSLAVVMVLHMRSKLFETLRLAVYDDAKGRERESANAGRMSTIIDSALPREYRVDHAHLVRLLLSVLEFSVKSARP
jgi:hypothetical protein